MLLNQTEAPNIINLRTMEQGNLLRFIAREFYRVYEHRVNHSFRILSKEELKPDPKAIVEIPGLEYLNTRDSYVNKTEKGYVVYIGRENASECIGIEIKESEC